VPSSIARAALGGGMISEVEQKERLNQLLSSDEVKHKYIESDATVTREGIVEALVAVFNNVDAVGDVIRPGAFSKSLRKWRESGKRLPLVWSHEVQEPAMIIGSADPADCYESESGLVVKGKLNIDNSATASHVYDLLRDGHVNGWSFGYRLVKSRRIDRTKQELLELHVSEAGPCINPCNESTRTVSVKGEPPHRGSEPVSHVELADALVRRGIISRPADMQGVFEQSRDTMLALLTGNGDGATNEEKSYAAPICAEDVQVRRFDC
jgi:HK97 family phage prohead protease